MLLAGFLSVATPWEVVQAEGTKEVFSDAGLYSGESQASLRTELYIWGFSLAQADTFSGD